MTDQEVLKMKARIEVAKRRVAACDLTSEGRASVEVAQALGEYRRAVDVYLDVQASAGGAR